MSDPNTLPCGHPASMLLMSAETGKPLYCEYCDCIARRNDAEQREREQGGRIAGAVTDGVLAKLKARLQAAGAGRGGEVWLTVRNPQ